MAPLATKFATMTSIASHRASHRYTVFASDFPPATVALAPVAAPALAAENVVVATHVADAPAAAVPAPAAVLAPAAALAPASPHPRDDSYGTWR
ncbi:hypothetical protein FBEOM_7670 [Fusarium beomiforme]|uniref:Uncharacterized protein n=1 Tax=Fusarium beomiforme TaxID=44412 RepID=A0A9P5AH09_9HYPO|nr:hypothetical protein FBEOM_7670 [Fusarium beomiforme]